LGKKVVFRIGIFENDAGRYIRAVVKSPQLRLIFAKEAHLDLTGFDQVTGNCDL
jgi:hypothetical protein